MYVYLAQTLTSEPRRKASMLRTHTVEHFPRSEKCSAHWIMTVRPTKHFLLKEKWLSSVFLKFKSLKLCQASEYSIILCEFLAKHFLKTAQNLSFHTSDGQTKKLTALLHSSKFPSQTVWQSDENQSLYSWKCARPFLNAASGPQVFSCPFFQSIKIQI